MNLLEGEKDKVRESGQHLVVCNDDDGEAKANDYTNNLRINNLTLFLFLLLFFFLLLLFLNNKNWSHVLRTTMPLVGDK